MYAPMDCQRLALKAPYRSKIRFDSFVALVRKAQGIEHDPPVIKYTPAAIRERNSALVGRSGRAHAGLWFLKRKPKTFVVPSGSIEEVDSRWPAQGPSFARKAFFIDSEVGTITISSVSGSIVQS